MCDQSFRAYSPSSRDWSFHFSDPIITYIVIGLSVLFWPSSYVWSLFPCPPQPIITCVSSLSVLTTAPSHHICVIVFCISLQPIITWLISQLSVPCIIPPCI
ncbi:hypothetical protein AVEN_212530-1 [Araneus ventricosus]|uniref:Uncharacterized protein n=1 Tax=Araneus ventricosus TaxID=182803 RepID=A0A4Y2T1V5_ARAVE|nr:hypothetical protein AVEN_212530-1 [Araneus ventricosus]